MGDFTFSEHGEDILIHRLLLWKERGFYVDCGAYHVRKMSLTARLRNFGWNGLNIDIDRKVIDSLSKDARGTNSVCAAISSCEEEVTFHRYEDPVLNTIDEKQYEHLQKIESAGELFTKFVGSEKIRATSIRTILAEQKLPDNTVNFLNLDIEGAEFLALDGFPWELQSPEVISIEIHRLDLNNCSSHPIISFLNSKGYVLQSYVFHTAIFMKKDFDTEQCHRLPFSKL